MCFTYVNPDRSFPNILMMAILNTRLEDTVNIPDIPVSMKFLFHYIAPRKLVTKLNYFIVL